MWKILFILFLSLTKCQSLENGDYFSFMQDTEKKSGYQTVVDSSDVKDSDLFQYFIRELKEGQPNGNWDDLELTANNDQTISTSGVPQEYFYPTIYENSVSYYEPGKVKRRTLIPVEVKIALIFVVLCYMLLTFFSTKGNLFEPSLRKIPLYELDVHHDKVTLSGFSSGGTFAQQMFVAHSSMFSGIGTFSHAYYRCGPGTGIQTEYDDACTTLGQNNTYNIDYALHELLSYKKRKLIDHTDNLKDKKLYIFAGTKSNSFNLDQSLGAYKIFEPLIQNPHNIRTRVQDAAQLLPSDRFGGPCSMSANKNFFIGNCGILGAFDALHFLLGDAIKYPSRWTKPKLGQLYLFDQTEFFGPENPHMDKEGFIYIPKHCYNQKCLLHVYFHGCNVGREFNGTRHTVNSGYLEVAEANNLIVLFPQALSSMPENLIGCFDTYGLTGEYYATKKGAQISVVRNMLAKILDLDTG